MASDVMCLCVFLLCSGLQFTTETVTYTCHYMTDRLERFDLKTSKLDLLKKKRHLHLGCPWGCKGEILHISRSAGESVLLPCGDINSRHTDVQWWISDSQTGTLQYSVFPVDAIKGQRYKDRVQIHGNLSLSIARLSVDDAGLYCCKTTDTDKMSPVHLTVEGCSISGNEGSVEISRYSGDSVFLSCLVKCSGRLKPDSEFRWKLPNNREIKQNIDRNELLRLYQGRFHMFNISSGNLSLLISNLTEKDEGLYSCWSNENQHKSFRLTVKGCTLSETEQEPKTKYTGDSVLLSCSCEDPNTKPEDFRWTHVESGTEVSSETPRYKHRVQMFHKTTPSNLSLLISNLTEDDQGTYRCTINNKTSADSRLIIKGCVLSEHHITESSYAGGSVILPCSCEDPKTKPEHFEWIRAVNETLVSDAEEINGRFQTIRESPHNLFLRISNLTETDGGLYVCSVNGKQSRRVTLTLTGRDSAVINALDYQYYLIFLVLLICLMLLVAGCIYWRFTRAKKRSRGSREIQRANDEDEVTYSTVMQIKGRKPAEKQQQNDVTYAAVAVNKRAQSTEDDVTYSSVTHIKGKKRPRKKEEEVVYSTMADMSRST